MQSSKPFSATRGDFNFLLNQTERAICAVSLLQPDFGTCRPAGASDN